MCQNSSLMLCSVCLVMMKSINYKSAHELLVFPSKMISQFSYWSSVHNLLVPLLSWPNHSQVSLMSTDPCILGCLQGWQALKKGTCSLSSWAPELTDHPEICLLPKHTNYAFCLLFLLSFPSLISYPWKTNFFFFLSLILRQLYFLNWEHHPISTLFGFVFIWQNSCIIDNGALLYHFLT